MLRALIRLGPLNNFLAFIVAAASAYLGWRAGGPPALTTLACLAAVTALVGWALSLHQEAAARSTGVDRTARDLAKILARQWTTAARQRGLTDPSPIPVAWQATGRPIAPSDADVAGTAAVLDPAWESGTADDIAQRWRRIPSGRLVILGPPGSGKTSLAVLLVCRLLADRATGGPIPVLLDLAGWNSRADRLQAWIARTVAAEYLKGRTKAGADHVAALFEEGRLLPVLDGFDELPAESRASAFSALNDAFDEPSGTSLPLVLTSRTRAYETAVETAERPLERAAVVEIAPVTAREAATYLPGGEFAARNRWKPVTETLTAEPDGPLAKVLSTPLNLYLARTAYDTPTTNPAELLDLVDPASLELHLLNAYVPAVYGRKHSALAAMRLRPYEPSEARRWLAYLALHCERFETRDIAWWQLHRSAGAGRLHVAALVLAAAATMFISALEQVRLGRWDLIIPVGLVLSVLVLVPSAAVGAAVIERRRVADLPLVGYVDLIGRLKWMKSRAVLVHGGLVFAFWMVLNENWMSLQEEPTGWDLGPVSEIGGAEVRRSFANGGTAAFAASIGVGIVLVLVARRIFSGFDWVIRRWSREARVVGQHPTPVRMLRTIHTTVLGYALFASLLGSGIAIADWWRPSLEQLVLWAVMFIEAVAVLWLVYARITGVWAFALACIVLAIRGRGPLRLMRFLDDAARRGVLRQSGPVYQFRHTRLQTYLAEQT
ncbi:NACHT domain-containing protein [Glycomyces harbinensis]|uniref:NACHT domain-containing protein n=1 Tax=Glycomyces harbinensis TaxID=58114 RepID=A0A1G6XJ09_9ACTN|nr:NACHT domain-containing protein [Glycomyces harbinensis]SDD77186.1 NACHT domain-containing protein [Glycomyces harbinensis]